MGPVAEQNNDMMWHDPNPKMKKVLVDKGTGVWGDPTGQGEIKRWKESEEVVVAPTTSSSAAQAGSVWDKSPVAPQPATPKSAAAAAGWGDAPARPSTEWGSTPGSNPDSASWPVPSKPVSGALSCLLCGVGAFQSTGEASAGGESVEGGSSDDVFANPGTPLNPLGGPINKDLTQQIAEQLRIAVQKGLININILNQHLPQNVLLVLNNLLQRVPKLEQATKELEVLRSQSNGQQLNSSQHAEYQRLSSEIRSLRSDIQKFQEQINQQTSSNMAQANGAAARTPNSGDPDTLPASKLLQWKNPQTPTSEAEKAAAKINNSSSVPNLEGLSLNEDPWNSGKFSGQNNVSWSPVENGVGGNGSRKSDARSETPTSATPTSTTPHKSNAAFLGAAGELAGVVGNNVEVEGPKEFIPGKKWEWRDPKEVAEDPNATPGSLRQNPLVNQFSSAFNQSPFGQPTFTLPSVGASGNITPTKYNYDLRPSATMSPSVPSDIWGSGVRRPPSFGQPFQPYGGPARLGPYNRSMSSPGQSAFAPYAAPGTPSWVILSNLSLCDENYLRNICGRIGKVMSLAYPANANFAVVKFAENVMERILPRLQQEVAPLGVSVQMAKDNEVDRLLQAVSGIRAPPNGLMTGWADGGGTPWGAPPFHHGMMGELMGAGMPPPTGLEHLSSDLGGGY